MRDCRKLILFQNTLTEVSMKKAVAYYRTSSISNVGEDKDSFAFDQTTNSLIFIGNSNYDKFIALIPKIITDCKFLVFVGHYVPGLLIMVATRIIKYYAFDKPKMITQNIINNYRNVIFNNSVK